MSFLPHPRHFTLPEFEAYVGALSWDKGWHPAFVTGHNTGSPRLSQYLAYRPDVRLAWPGNLNHYYRGLGWHSGPHLVICPLVEGGGIWQLCDLEEDGVSVSCWNRKTIGIECVGDYETEDPTTGHGAEVRDQFVGVVTALCRRLGWRPRPQVLGVSGVHWHHQCTKDHHPCPGRNWDGDAVIARIEAALGSGAEALSKAPQVPSSPPQIPAAPSVIRDTRWVQQALNAVMGTHLVEDGIAGPQTSQVTKAYQAKTPGLAVDGIAGPKTIAALEKAMGASAPTPGNMAAGKAVAMQQTQGAG